MKTYLTGEEESSAESGCKNLSNLPSSVFVLAHVAELNWMKTIRRETRINLESITQQSDQRKALKPSYERNPVVEISKHWMKIYMCFSLSFLVRKVHGG